MLVYSEVSRLKYFYINLVKPWCAVPLETARLEMPRSSWVNSFWPEIRLRGLVLLLISCSTRQSGSYSWTRQHSRNSAGGVDLGVQYLKTWRAGEAALPLAAHYVRWAGLRSTGAHTGVEGEGRLESWPTKKLPTPGPEFQDGPSHHPSVIYG